MTELTRPLKCVDVQPLTLCTAAPVGAPGAPSQPAPRPRLQYPQPQLLPSGFVPGAPPCCCSTPAAMELGQNLWVGRCCDLIFLALGAGSGLLASSMGCRMRLRALMNLPRGKMEPGKSPPGGGSMCAQVRVSVCACVCTRVRVCAESAKPLPDSQKLVLVRNRPGSGLRCGSTAVISPGHRGARDVTRGLGDHKPAWDECVRRVRNLCSRPVRTEQRKEEPPSQRH